MTMSSVSAPQVRVWEPSADGFVASAMVPSHAGVVRALAALSPDCLASTSDDRTVRIWCVCAPVSQSRFT